MARFPLSQPFPRWILDLNRNARTKVSGNIDAGWGGVAWSADGKHVFASLLDAATHRMDIYKIDADGTARTNLTEDLLSRLGAAGEYKVVSDVGSSRDGQFLTFLFAPQVGRKIQKKSRIALMRTDGSDVRFITDGGSLAPGMRGAFSVGDFDPEMSAEESWGECSGAQDFIVFLPVPA